MIDHKSSEQNARQENPKTPAQPLTRELLSRHIPEGIHSIHYVGPSDLLGDLSEHCVLHNIHLECSEALPHQIQARVDLCLLVLHSDAPDAASLSSIGTAKNLFSERLWLLLPHLNNEWRDQDLFALGLRKDPDAPKSMKSYTYNLVDYNRKRTWNSPEGWANPDKWNLRF